MLKTMTICLCTALLAVTSPAAWANPEDPPAQKRYQIGMRSAIVLGHMGLSGLDPGFNDLSADANLAKGAHHSSVFLLKQIRPWLRIGFETLSGNSDETAETTMDFQGAGFVAEVRRARTWVFAAGTHAGAVIVDAFHRESDTTEERLHTGTFYKNSGLFVAPYVAGGLIVRSAEVLLFVKPVFVFAPSAGHNIDAFSAMYGGVTVGWSL